MKASDLIAASGWKSESIALFPFAPEESISVGQRLNVRIFSHEPLAAEPVDPKDIPHYWGYETEIVESLEGYLAAKHEQGGYVVLTSRNGKAVTPEILSNMGHIRPQARSCGGLRLTRTRRRCILE